MTGRVVRSPTARRLSSARADSQPKHITPREFGHAVAAGVLDPLVAILDGYTVYGGGAVDPPAMFFEWLRDHRAHQTVTPRALAPDHLETANWCGGTDRHLMRLHTSAGLLREELAQLDRILERTEHEPTAESVEAMLRGLESAGIFLRQAYRALGMEMVQEPPELLQ